MEKVTPNYSLSNSFRQNWEYLRKLDQKAHAATTASKALSDRLQLSTKYRLQTQAIQHGTKVVLENRLDTDLFKQSISKFDKLNQLAKRASNGASAVTYESLVEHIKAGKAINTFDWKGLIKGRGWSHVDHVTCITKGSAKALGKLIALNLAKALIVYDAYRDAKTTYLNNRQKGLNSISCVFKASVTAIKEIGKSLVSWEFGALGAAVATVCFPALGFFGMMCGGVLFGGVMGYLLERYIPSPVKEPVTTISETEVIIPIKHKD